MNLELIPTLLLSLLLLASDGADAGVARVVLSGDHRLDATDEATIVGDATVTIPAGTEIAAPVYIIGGRTRIDGAVSAQVTQIAGTLTIGGKAQLAALRHIGGTHTIQPDADIARRTSVDLATGTDTPLRSAVVLAFVAGLLAAVGARLERTRRRNLDTIARALARHPVVTATVGALLTVTALSLLVFMAFTLVLVPVSILGLFAGVVVAALGVVVWGHRLGRRLPLHHPHLATAAGVASTVLTLQLLGAVPIAGDAIVGFVLLSGLGAVVVTYLGFADFHLAQLPD